MTPATGRCRLNALTPANLVHSISLTAHEGSRPPQMLCQESLDRATDTRVGSICSHINIGCGATESALSMTPHRLRARNALQGPHGQQLTCHSIGSIGWRLSLICEVCGTLGLAGSNHPRGPKQSCAGRLRPFARRARWRARPAVSSSFFPAFGCMAPRGLSSSA
jgi:hypothetical protein